MFFSTRRRPRRAAFAVAAALFLTFLGVTAVAAPASAHDELISTDPAADASLTETPPEITLTFSAELLGDGGANEVQVTDASGALLADGPAVVDGVTVTQALTPGASGPIAVVWRVVSSDGHPISGEFAFTVAGSSTPEPAPTTTTAAPTSPAPASPTGAPTSTPTADPAPAGDSGDVSPVVWIVLGVVAAAVGAAVMAVLVTRARRRQAGGDGSGPGADR